MKTHHILSAAAGLAVLSLGATVTHAAPVPVINGDAESFSFGPARSVNIGPDGADPLVETNLVSTTGWRGTTTTDGQQAIFGTGDTAAVDGGEYRLATGTADPAVDISTLRLYQETDAVVAAGDTLTLDYIGQGFFNFDPATNGGSSFFGYLDGGGNVVEVDAKAAVNMIVAPDFPSRPTSWMPEEHVFVVPDASPLIGENLVIGFFTTSDAADTNGGYSSYDNVALDVTGAGIPEPASLSLLGLGGLGLLRRRKA